jgi:hypothetical protein
MDVFVGIDVAREVHWACAMDCDARVLFLFHSLLLGGGCCLHPETRLAAASGP